MAFVKKFLVLKEIGGGYSVNGKGVSGVARAESENGKTAVNVSLINFAAVTEGEYVAMIVLGNEKFIEYLGANPFSLSREYDAAADGFACFVAHAAEEKFTPVAAGISAEAKFGVDALTEILSEKFKKNKPPAPKSEGAADTVDAENYAYDDETVATENYYLNPDADAETLTIKDLRDEQTLHTADFRADDEGKAEKSRSEEKEKIYENEKHFAFGEKSRNFYLTVKKELDGIFDRYPADDSLEKTLPGSKWVRINYGENKYYVVGIITEKGAPKYICYGVPSPYGEYPPKELAGFCSFIPRSVFDMRGDGFWMMFQDAETGECVHMK